MTTKNKGGRPTKLTPDVLLLAQDYIDNYKEKYGDVVPTVVGLAITLDVATKTIYNWAIPENPSFLHIFNTIEQKQHRDLVNGGLAGGFNPAVSKMMMTHHGYSDKVEQKHTTDGSMSPKPTVINLVAPKDDDIG